MRLKPQYVVILAIAGVILLYFGIRSLLGGNDNAQAKAPPAAASVNSCPAAVKWTVRGGAAPAGCALK